MSFPPNQAAPPLPTAPRKRRLLRRLKNPLSRIVIVGSASLIVMGLGLHGLNLKILHDDAVAAAKSETRNLTRVLAEHTARVFEAADRTLLAVVELHDHSARGERLKTDPLHQSLKGIQNQSDVVRRLAWVDAAGRRIGTSYDDPNESPSFATRDFFRVQALADDVGLYIARPYKPRALNGPWALTISRRLSRPDGSFDGVAVALVDPYYFANLYRSIGLGETRAAGLMHRDGTILSRVPDTETMIGRSAADGQVFRLLREADEGTINGVSLSQEPRIVSYAAVKGYPLLVVVSIGTAEALASWYRQLLFSSAAFAAFLILYLVVARLLVQQLERDEGRRRVLDIARRDAVAANKAKSAFLSHMSHELRTPLNAILGFAELIRDRFNPQRLDLLRTYATEIHTAGAHLLDLINDILDFAKIEAQRRKLEEAPIDLCSVAAGVLRQHGPVAEKAGLALEMAFPADLPLLLGDERALVQMLNNLVTNAIKFTPRGGRVEISAAATANGLTLGVRDTGIGIAPEDQPRLFQRFAHSRDPLVSSPRGGTGLGLAIVKGLIELHGGRIDLASTPGQGTTVTLSFPATRVVAARAAA